MLGTLALAVLTALPMQDPPGTISGRVRSAGTGAPIPYAVVEVLRANADPIRVEANANGIYIIANVPAGSYTVRASHIDHAPHEVLGYRVFAGRNQSVGFDLAVRPVRLDPMVARAGHVPQPLRDTMTVRPEDLGVAARRALEVTPGVAELGLADAANAVPGYEPVDPSDVLFVRGATEDLKVVYLNGAPVFAPFQVGGLLTPIDGDLFRSTTLHVGGSPSRYDGGLSYVMDLETRSGRANGMHANVAVDMVAAKGAFEGPIGNRASFIVAGRGVHGRGAAPFIDQPFPYEYADGLGRVDVDLGNGRVLSMTGFWNRENVRLDSVQRNGNEAEWGNRAGSVRLRSEIGGMDALFTLAAGDFATRLPYGGLRVWVTEGTSNRLRGAADFGRTIGPGRVNFGGSIDRVAYGQNVWPLGFAQDSVLYRSRTAGTVGGVYIDASTNPVDRVQVRAGLRADVFSLASGVHLGPRISATMLVTERVALTIAAGQYRQFVRADDSPLAVIVTPGLAIPGAAQKLDVASASHFMAALDQELGEGISLSLEGYYKAFEGLPSTGGAKAEASGVDLWVRRNRGALNGWFGYSLAWVWSDDGSPGSADDNLFAGRQVMTAGVMGPLIGKGRFDVRFAYGAGLPFAAIPEPDAGTPVISVGFVDQPAFAMAAPLPSRPDAPDQPYLRLDAQVERTFNAEWNGFNFSVTPYVKVFNALDRRDGVFYYQPRGTDSGPLRAVAGLPVLPVLGFDWRF